ncbi:MAG: hypothetical protein ACHQM6_09705 [Candidatus Kapaibacterium sp.]
MWNDIKELVAVIIGSIITIISTSFTEKRKRKSALDDAYRIKQREALELLMKHVDPIRNAFDHFRFQAGTSMYYGRRESNTKVPNLLSELSKLDLSAAQRAILPPKLYEFEFEIMRRIETLQMAISDEPASKEKKDAYFNFDAAVEAEIISYHNRLKDEYKNTFLSNPVNYKPLSSFFDEHPEIDIENNEINEVLNYMESLHPFEVIDEVSGEVLNSGMAKGGPLPVNPGYIHTYNGKEYRITNIERNQTEEKTIFVKAFAVPVTDDNMSSLRDSGS